MSQNAQRHYHLPSNDGRSLCDRHAGAAFAPRQPGEDVRVCGACVLVVEDLIGQVKGFIARFGEPHPDPTEAADLLRITRWGQRLNIDEIQEELARTGYTYPGVTGSTKGQEES